MRLRPLPSSARSMAIAVSFVARRWVTRRPPGGGRGSGAAPPASSARARSRRSLASGSWTVIRNASDSSGSWPNVRTTRRRVANWPKTSSTGARASRKFPAWASTSTPARWSPLANWPRAGDRPRDPAAHLVELGAGELAQRDRDGGQRSRRPQGVERARERRLGQGVADAGRSQGEGLRERAGDDQVVVLGDERLEVPGVVLAVGLVDDHDAPDRRGRSRRPARGRPPRRSGCSGCRARRPGPAARPPRPRPSRARGVPGRGATASTSPPAFRVATAYSWYVGRATTATSPRLSASWAHRIRISSQPAPTTTCSGSRPA